MLRGMSEVLGDTTRQQILALGRLGWALSRIHQAMAFAGTLRLPFAVARAA
jgi:hypothetical protein